MKDQSKTMKKKDIDETGKEIVQVEEAIYAV